MSLTLEEPTVSIEEAAKLLGIGRGLAYREARSGSLAGIPVLRLGPKRMRIGRQALARVLAGETVRRPVSDDRKPEPAR